MDVVLVGLSGSGKSVVGKRLAARHGAAFLDVDDAVAVDARASVPEIFATEGEAGFRARERRVIQALGPAATGGRPERVVSTGGGAVIDPRNRWRLYRGRVAVWLDAPPEILAQRLRRSRHVRPLVAGSRDPVATLRDLAEARTRFYAPARVVNGLLPLPDLVRAVERVAAAGPPRGVELLRAETRLGRLTIGDGHAATALVAALRDLGAGRAIIVSEPTAWAAAGSSLAAALRSTGLEVVDLFLPEGEAAKRLAVVEEAARTLVRHGVERGEPIVAVGGGALGDSAGFLAATYARGLPLVHVPTTLVAQVDSAIGGKTAVDLPEGKNLVGAFHQPAAIVADVALLASLPEHHRRAALGEAVKMAVLGDDRLFELLEADGPAIAGGAPSVAESGALAELVERCAWAKVEIVLDDERERADGRRIHLNLGHSIGHALEAAAGFEGLLHGEAVAHGLRGACRIAVEVGLMPPDRARRVEDLLDRLGLTGAPLPYPAPAVLAALGSDKKRAGGRLRWVLPTEDGVVVHADVPDELVGRTVGELVAGTPAPWARPLEAPR